MGDVASHLGCTVGLKDSVTAVTFIALGTCLPGTFFRKNGSIDFNSSFGNLWIDLFASLIACVREEHCDDAFINLTGANMIKVYLGIGVGWTMGAVYQVANGNILQVTGETT